MKIIEHFRHARNVVSVPAGTHLFREGDPGDVMYVVLEGKAEVAVAGVQVELATAGAILGEMALIDDAPRSASVLCRTPCRLVPVDRPAFDLLVHETPAFARHVMSLLAERMRRMNERLAQAVARPPMRR
jgi:CRP/FNR family transcriptional regulator, cyclic AMP receptor protein